MSSNNNRKVDGIATKSLRIIGRDNVNKSITAILIAFCFVTCISNSSVAQSSSRFDITFDSQWESKLKSLGTLQSTVRDDSRGVIVAIQIEYADTQNEPHVQMNVPFTIAGDACQLTLTDELLTTARKQPVRIPIPENSQFSQVFLNYNQSNAGSSTRGDGIAATTNSGSANSGSGNDMLDQGSGTSNSATTLNSGSPDTSVAMHFVKLSDRKVLMGQMNLTEKLKFTTKFGEVDIALGQIAGIRFHIDGEDSALIVLKNGDSVTGIPAMESLNLNTDWGRAEFDPVYVDEITTSQRASFTRSNDPQFGQRWTLTNR